jgi:hypothetical protein
VHFEVSIEYVRNKWTGDSKETLNLLVDELTSTKAASGKKYEVAMERASSPPLKRKKNSNKCFKCCNGGGEQFF